jgi:hypothetical protein
MASQKGKSKPQNPARGKPGSDRDAANAIGGKGDFGVPVNRGRTPDLDYVNENTKASDPGASQPGSAEFEGVRTHGAGGKASGEGSSSGGDLDTDFIGVGTGGSGISANPSEKYVPGPDDTDGSSAEMAHGAPAAGENQTGVGKIGGPAPVERTMAKANYPNQSEPLDQGSDVASQGDQADNITASSGEVSMHEASGGDLPLSPSQDDQGIADDPNAADNEDQR